MAIMTILDTKKWKYIEILTKEVILNRKSKFQKGEILEVIKKKLAIKNIDEAMLDCSYFEAIFLSILEEFVRDGNLYLVDDFYIPFNYMITDEYDTKEGKLLYLSYDNENQPIYIDIDTLKTTNYNQDRDFLLTGGKSEEISNHLLVSNISFGEISSLYHSFLEEGSSVEEAINLVLNYYDIQVVPSVNEGVRVLFIRNKKKKTFGKVLKKDNYLISK